MLEYMKKVNSILRFFTVLDTGIFKVCLMVFGIILGVYFYSFFEGLKVVLWIVFIITWLYIVIKVFVFYWDKKD